MAEPLTQCVCPKCGQHSLHVCTEVQEGDYWLYGFKENEWD